MSNATRFETVVHPSGIVEFIACDGDGEIFNRYETLLADRQDNLHLSFDVKRSELHVVLLSESGDVGLSYPMTAQDLAKLGQKFMKLSLEVATTGGHA